MIGKYVEKLLHFEEKETEQPSGITMDFLKSHGF